MNNEHYLTFGVCVLSIIKTATFHHRFDDDDFKKINCVHFEDFV